MAAAQVQDSLSAAVEGVLVNKRCALPDASVCSNEFNCSDGDAFQDFQFGLAQLLCWG